MTLIELIVVLAVCFVLLSMLLPAMDRCKCKAPRITCVNDLKQIGTAYKVWAGDNNDNYPFQSETNGWKSLLANPRQGRNCWKNFAIMADELGQSPKVVMCPSDERSYATSFVQMGNTNVSYFVNVGASESSPQSLLGGDRNLGRGIEADPNYGFSPADGWGNDVAIQTNSTVDPISFSLKIHSAGTSVGAGDVLLCDGSVQQVSSQRFRTEIQPFSGHTNNWPQAQVPGSPSFRLIFP